MFHRRIQLGLALLLWSTASALAGCWGRCPDLMEGYETAIRTESARVGTGISILGGGEYHIGMTLSPELVQELLAAGNQKLAAIYTRLGIEHGSAGYRSAVEILAQPFLVGMRPVDPTSGQVQLDCRIEARVTIRAPGNRMDHFLIGSFGILGNLRFQLDEQGVPALELDLLEYSEQEVALQTQELPESIAQAVEQYLGPALSERLFSEVRTVTLARFPPVLLRTIYMSLSPVGLLLDPREDTLFLGFVTNLRPSWGGFTQAVPDAVEEGMRLTIHPGLGAAAVRLALAEGRLPRRYSVEGRFEPEGPVHITLEGMEFSRSQVVLRFRTWDTREDHCRSSVWTVLSEIVQDTGTTVQIVPEAIEGDETSGSSTSIQPEQWLHSVFIEEALDVAEQLINLSRIQLSSGLYLELSPVALQAESDHLTVDLLVGGD